MKVRTVASVMVLPQTLSPQTILWMSSMDVMHGDRYVKTVYFYKPDGSANFFSLDILIEALSAVLVLYYPLAGRLQTDRNGRLEINCSGAGVLLVKAAADTRIEDLGDFTPSPGYSQLIPNLDDTQDMSTRPLVMLQVTLFECGGVSLGVGAHHAAADGLAWVHFINTWSDLARGVAPKVRPVFDRTLLKARSPPAPMFSHVEYQTPPQLIRPPQKDALNKSLHDPRAKSEEAPANLTFIFSMKLLQELKACSCENMAKYSTYETLAGHIWRCFCEARELSPDQETKLFVVTDGRSRVVPPLPEGYCGNAVFRATPILTAGDVMAKPLCFTAGKIHEAVVRMDDEYLRSAIDFVELETDKPSLRKGSRAPNVKINSWGKLSMYECDFGWGKPIGVSTVFLPVEGLCYLLPTPEQDGSLKMYVALEPHQMLKFKGLLLDASHTHS